jgi:hypothetical protein
MGAGESVMRVLPSGLADLLAGHELDLLSFTAHAASGLPRIQVSAARAARHPFELCRGKVRGPARTAPPQPFQPGEAMPRK